MKECPKKEKLNAIIETEESEVQYEAPRRVNPIRMVNVLRTEEMVKTHGLLYVNVIINGQSVMAMVDTGDTNSFVSEKNVKLLGLELQPSTSQFKAVNVNAQQVGGVACVSVKIGPWEGKCKLLAMPLDDFDIIFRMDFLLAENVSGILEKWDKGKVDNGLLSALQVEARLKHGEVTYLPALVEVKPDQIVEVPDHAAEILREFDDVMPPELPKSLPPRRAIDHKIELEPDVRPPPQAPYRMGPSELGELRK
ncbi:uncharacterized protein LOC141666125 [Apium graveolens]|uniref:uncharacterized protein LOC141666125 n=1 Tax=Apium graveolens TaxID=4045 RepID=UPI003D7B9CAC